MINYTGKTISMNSGGKANYCEVQNRYSEIK